MVTRILVGRCKLKRRTKLLKHPGKRGSQAVYRLRDAQATKWASQRGVLLGRQAATE